MAASHATPQQLSQRRAGGRSQAKIQRRPRANLVLGSIALVLLAILVAGIVGLLTTVEPTTTGGTVKYAADGSNYINPPHMAIFWLWLTMMDVAAIFAFGVAAAATHQS